MIYLKILCGAWEHYSWYNDSSQSFRNLSNSKSGFRFFLHWDFYTSQSDQINLLERSSLINSGIFLQALLASRLRCNLKRDRARHFGKVSCSALSRLAAIGIAKEINQIRSRRSAARSRFTNSNLGWERESEKATRSLTRINLFAKGKHTNQNFPFSPLR